MTWGVYRTGYSCNSVVCVLCGPQKKEAERPKKVVEEVVEEEVVHEENDWGECSWSVDIASMYCP